MRDNQIYTFKRDRARPKNYIQIDGETLPFTWFTLDKPRSKKYNGKAKYCIDYFKDSRRTFITGLRPIHGICNLYVGDISKETAAIGFSDNMNIIKIVTFNGHRVKTLNSRIRKVLEFVKEKRNARHTSNIPFRSNIPSKDNCYD